MEQIGAARFFGSHSASVRAVAFCPTERYLFASGGNDGNVCLYHAGRAELLNIFTVITNGLNRHINAIRYTCDGKKVCPFFWVSRSRALRIKIKESVVLFWCFLTLCFIHPPDSGNHYLTTIGRARCGPRPDGQLVRELCLQRP